MNIIHQSPSSNQAAPGLSTGALISAQYTTLPGLQMMLSERGRKAVGTLGERFAALELERAGYSVVFNQHKTKSGDLRIVNPETGELWRVEVKTAQQSRSGRWQFNLVKQGCTDFRHADVVILLAVLKSGRVVHFIIPTSELANIHKITLCSHPENYAGQFKVYRRKTWRLE